MKRICVGHPFLGRGGSEARVMWLIEALKCHAHVEVATTGGWDLDELNYIYGTRIRPDEVRVRTAPLGRLLVRQPVAAWRAGIYQRFCRSIAHEYAARISAYNCTDWGLPAVHFIADLSWCSAIREQFDLPTPGLFYRNSFLRRVYLSAGRAWAKPSGREPLRDDTVIANSEWMATILERMCGSRPAVIYPPVPTDFPVVPWDQKTPDFFCISRIEPEKRIEDLIAILTCVRSLGHPVKLSVIGGFPDTPYARRLSSLCRQNAHWIVMEGPAYGARKAHLLPTFRYGIHACRREAFGITVAEMIKAGAIAFAPSCGGQVEILGEDTLLYRDENDAVSKIVSVLAEPATQIALRAKLAERAKLFSSERFVSEVRRSLLDSIGCTN